MTDEPLHMIDAAALDAIDRALAELDRQITALERLSIGWLRFRVALTIELIVRPPNFR